MYTDWLNNDAAVGALIGGGFALGGTILSNWLVHKNDIKAKIREAKSKTISNVVIQYRNIEKGIDYMILIEIHKEIIIAIKERSYKSVWTEDQIQWQMKRCLNN